MKTTLPVPVGPVPAIIVSVLVGACLLAIAGLQFSS
jgi:hypothetical protein